MRIPTRQRRLFAITGAILFLVVIYFCVSAHVRHPDYNWDSSINPTERRLLQKYLERSASVRNLVEDRGWVDSASDSFKGRSGSVHVERSGVCSFLVTIYTTSLLGGEVVTMLELRIDRSGRIERTNAFLTY